MKGERKKIKEILNKHSPITLTNFVNINRKSNRKKSVKNFN